jgi:cytochrome b561
LHWRNSASQYGAVAQLLHWGILVLVIVQVILAARAIDLPVSLERLQLFARHKSLGMTVLVLAVLRLGWRLANPQPEPPAPPPLHSTNTAGVLQRLARVTHWLFYVLLVTIPVSGWIFSSASNLSVSWFGWFTWPDLVGRNESLADVASATHKLLVACLLLAIALHAAAAFMHHFIWRDEVLKRMWPTRRLLDEENTI